MTSIHSEIQIGRKLTACQSVVLLTLEQRRKLHVQQQIGHRLRLQPQPTARQHAKHRQVRLHKQGKSVHRQELLLLKQVLPHRQTRPTVLPHVKHRQVRLRKQGKSARRQELLLHKQVLPHRQARPTVLPHVKHKQVHLRKIEQRNQHKIQQQLVLLKHNRQQHHNNPIQIAGQDKLF